jgi:hypothetical protein
MFQLTDASSMHVLTNEMAVEPLHTKLYNILRSYVQKLRNWLPWIKTRDTSDTAGVTSQWQCEKLWKWRWTNKQLTKKIPCIHSPRITMSRFEKCDSISISLQYSILCSYCVYKFLIQNGWLIVLKNYNKTSMFN